MDILVVFTEIVKDFLTEAKQHVQKNILVKSPFLRQNSKSKAIQSGASVSNENVQIRKQDLKD